MAGFIKRIIEHCYTQNIKASGLVVSVKKIFVYLSYCTCKYMGANIPWGGAILNPRSIIGRIYVKHHITLLHTKYTSFGSCGFKRRFSHMFPIISLWQMMTSLGCGLYGPQGHGCQVFSSPEPKAHKVSL